MREEKINIIEKENTVSTNEDVKSLGFAEEFTAVLAYNQSGGKGSNGREFISPFGGAYFSFLYYPPKNILPLTTCLAAVAVRKTIFDNFGVGCGIKWVNDLIFDGKKVCGILTETKTEGDLSAAVVGIGVNLFRPENGYGIYDGTAGYILNAEPSKKIIRDFASAVINNFSALSHTDFMFDYRKYSAVIGKDVRFVRNGKEIFCKAVDINGDGSLVLDAEEGIITVTDGRIFLL